VRLFSPSISKEMSCSSHSTHTASAGEQVFVFHIGGKYTILRAISQEIDNEFAKSFESF